MKLLLFSARFYFGALQSNRLLYCALKWPKHAMHAIDYIIEDNLG